MLIPTSPGLQVRGLRLGNVSLLPSSHRLCCSQPWTVVLLSRALFIKWFQRRGHSLKHFQVQFLKLHSELKFLNCFLNCTSLWTKLAMCLIWLSTLMETISVTFVLAISYRCGACLSPFSFQVINFMKAWLSCFSQNTLHSISFGWSGDKMNVCWMAT